MAEWIGDFPRSSGAKPDKCVPVISNETRRTEALESIAKSLKLIAERLSKAA